MIDREVKEWLKYLDYQLARSTFLVSLLKTTFFPYDGSNPLPTRLATIYHTATEAALWASKEVLAEKGLGMGDSHF